MPEMKSPGGGRQSLARASVSQALGRAGAYSTTPPRGMNAARGSRRRRRCRVSVRKGQEGPLYDLMLFAWGGYDWRPIEPSKPAAARRAAARTVIVAIDGGQPTRVWLKPVEGAAVLTPMPGTYSPHAGSYRCRTAWWRGNIACEKTRCIPAGTMPACFWPA